MACREKIQTFWLAFGDPLALTPAFPDNSLTTPAAGPGPHFKPDLGQGGQDTTGSSHTISPNTATQETKQ